MFQNTELGNRLHVVTQYHFTAWPDHGVPDYATAVLAFHRRLRGTHHPSIGPMLIHCRLVKHHCTVRVNEFKSSCYVL